MANFWHLQLYEENTILPLQGKIGDAVFSWTQKPTRQKHNSSIRTNRPAQMFSLYEDTTYFLRILMHLYPPCWGRFLNPQRIRTGGFTSTAFRVTVNLSKCTTRTATANYKKSSKKEEPLFPLHYTVVWLEATDRPEPSLILTPRTIK